MSKSKSKRINATTKITEDKKRKFRLLKNTSFSCSPNIPIGSVDNAFLGHKYAIFAYVPLTINHAIIDGWAPWHRFTATTDKEALNVFNESIKSYRIDTERLNDYYTVLKEV